MAKIGGVNLPINMFDIFEKKVQKCYRWIKTHFPKESEYILQVSIHPRLEPGRAV